MGDIQAIGIDFGTSTSLIGTYREAGPFVIPDPASGSRSIPSLIAITDRGELVVGEEARAWVDIPGYGVREVKRLMGTGDTVRLRDQTYRPEELAATIIKYLVRNAEEALNKEIKKVVLSVPANFPDAARRATLHAGELAGVEVLRLINEPTAAALAFGVRHIDAEGQIIVFDFGGGTLDVTTLEMIAGVVDVKSSFGDPRLGGKDIDQALMDLIVSKFKDEVGSVQIGVTSMQHLKAEAELAKIRLSTEHSTVVRMHAFAMRNGSPVDLEVPITRDEFNRAISPLLDRARACIRQALNAKKIRPSAIDRVLLVGGSTYIPAVRQLVAEMFAREPQSSVDPDLAVCMGTTVQSALVQDVVDYSSGIILTDVAPYGMGTGAVNYVGGQYIDVYSELMPPNTTIPYSVTHKYRLLFTDQTSVDIRLYQDHTGNARVPEDAVDTGIHGEISDIPPSTTGIPHEVDVEFSYDLNGIVQVTATLPATGHSVEIRWDQSKMHLSPGERKDAASRVEALWRTSSMAGRYEAVINRAEQLSEMVSGAQKVELTEAIDALKSALADDDPSLIERAGDRLVDLLFDLNDAMGM